MVSKFVIFFHNYATWTLGSILDAAL